MVNLGGVLLNLGKPDQALQLNLYAVLRRPTDALANSQLGMSYFLTRKPDLAEKYLTTTKQLDPAHFSHPQLLLSEIHLQRNEHTAAIEELEDFLRRHPDSPEAAGRKGDDQSVAAALRSHFAGCCSTAVLGAAFVGLRVHSGDVDAAFEVRSVPQSRCPQS